jgi:hypothetical protein
MRSKSLTQAEGVVLNKKKRKEILHQKITNTQAFCLLSPDPRVQEEKKKEKKRKDIGERGHSMHHQSGASSAGVVPVTIVGDLQIAAPPKPVDFDLPFYLFPELATHHSLGQTSVLSQTVRDGSLVKRVTVSDRIFQAVDASAAPVAAQTNDGGAAQTKSQWLLAPLETVFPESDEESSNRSAAKKGAANPRQTSSSSSYSSLAALIARNYMPALQLDDSIFGIVDAGIGGGAPSFTSETLLHELLTFSRNVQASSEVSYERYLQAVASGTTTSSTVLHGHVPLPPAPALTAQELKPLLTNHFLNVLAWIKLRELNGAAATSSMPCVGGFADATSARSVISEGLHRKFGLAGFSSTLSVGVQCSYDKDPATMLGINTMLPVANFDHRVEAATVPYSTLFAAFLTQESIERAGAPGKGWGLVIWSAGEGTEALTGEEEHVFVPLRVPSTSSAAAFTFIGRDASYASCATTPNCPLQHERVDVGLRPFTHVAKTIAPLHMVIVGTRRSQDAPDSGCDESPSSLSASVSSFDWSLLVFGRNGVRVGDKHVFDGPAGLAGDGSCVMSVADVRIRLVKK